VVVFPFVPVTPASSSSFVGSSKKMSAATGIDSRTEDRSWGTSTSSSLSTTTATLPRSIASQARYMSVDHALLVRRRTKAPSVRRRRVIGEVEDLERPSSRHLGRARALMRASSCIGGRLEKRFEAAQPLERSCGGASCGISKC
jgi:hypothetical protein